VKPKDLLFSLSLRLFWSLQRKRRFFDSGCAFAQNDGVTPLNDKALLKCYCLAKLLIYSLPREVRNRKVSLKLFLGYFALAALGDFSMCEYSLKHCVKMPITARLLSYLPILWMGVRAHEPLPSVNGRSLRGGVELVGFAK
jgi:hypothetical protein